MLRSICAECLKLRHSRIGLVLIVLPIISLLIGCANFYLNQGVLHNGWYSLWTQVSLFYGEFFLPILIAICCAYVCRLEHQNRNWNTIMASPVPVASLFFAKMIVVSMLILIVQALFLCLYWFAGTLFSLPRSLAYGDFKLDLTRLVRVFIHMCVSVMSVAMDSQLCYPDWYESDRKSVV